MRHCSNFAQFHYLVQFAPEFSSGEWSLTYKMICLIIQHMLVQLTLTMGLAQHLELGPCALHCSRSLLHMGRPSGIKARAK